MRLEHFGYREQDILAHTLAWLRHAVEWHEREETDRFRVLGRLMLQTSLVTGAAAAGAENAGDLYEQIDAGLRGEDAENDDAWLLNPHATTDVAKLSQFLARKDQERQQ